MFSFKTIGTKSFAYFAQSEWIRIEVLLERVKGVTKTMIFSPWIADSSHSS